MNLIEDNLIFFKVKNNINIIVQEDISSLKKILQDKLKKAITTIQIHLIIKSMISCWRKLRITFVKILQLTINRTLYNEKQNKIRRNTNNSIDTKKINNHNFNIISTLLFSVKLVVYSCSHRKPLPKRIHRFTKCIVTISKDCLI